MRIARFSLLEEHAQGRSTDPRFGIVGTNPEGQETLLSITGDPLYAGVQPTGETIPLEHVKLLAPVIPRSKVVCVGRNYLEHIKEMANDVPQEPLLFFKPNTAVIGPREAIVWPRGSEQVEHEGELAIVIGRLCKEVPRERAKEVIFGYTIANDVTARDWQKSDGQWARAKGFDTSCPLGPWIETDLDTSDLEITVTVDGALRQKGRTSQMIFQIDEIVEYVSRTFTLLPGDIILTGTPSGVGLLPHGSEVSVTIEGLGTLTNKVVRNV